MLGRCLLLHIHSHASIFMPPATWVQVVSTMANTSLTEVATRSSHPCLLFQLYVIKDRQLVASWVAQAEAAGYKAIMVTVDAPRLGKREADERNRWACMRSMARFELAPACGTAAWHSFNSPRWCCSPLAGRLCMQVVSSSPTLIISLPSQLSWQGCMCLHQPGGGRCMWCCRFQLPSNLELANLAPLARSTPSSQRSGLLQARDTSQGSGGGGGSGLFQLFAKEVDDSLTWEFLPWVKSVTKLPVYVKVGVLVAGRRSVLRVPAAAANARTPPAVPPGTLLVAAAPSNGTGMLAQLMSPI